MLKFEQKEKVTERAHQEKQTEKERERNGDRESHILRCVAYARLVTVVIIIIVIVHSTKIIKRTGYVCMCELCSMCWLRK